MKSEVDPRRARRSSWASSQRRRPSTDGAISSNGTAGLYSKQMNPYKQHSSSLRSGNTEFRYGRTRGDLDGVEFGLDVIDGQLNNDGDDDDDDDDDDMKLDNILASIVDDSKKAPVEIKSNNSELIDLLNGCATAVTRIEATSSVVKSKDLYVTSVDFGKDTTHRSKSTSPTHRQNADSSNNEAGSISPVSEEDNDTFASAMLDDSDSLIKRVAQSQSEPQPTFASSEGFEDAMRFESTRMPPISSFRLNEGNNGGSILGSESLLSIIEDGMNNYTKDKRVLTPPRGLYSAYSDRSHAQESTHLEDHPHIKSNNNAPQLIPASAKTNRKSSHSKATTQNHVGGVIVQNGAEDETLSTVTDPAEAPFIFTYKRSHDDDSVSQITSSLAGSSSSPYQLQNVPSSTGMRNKNDSLSWMKSNSDGTRTGGMVIQGLYGRDRNRKSPYKGSRWNKGSSISGSANSGSFNGANNSLDEIEYALNSDCKSGRKQRSNVIRRPFGRIGSASGFDDLSTVVSTNSRDSLQGDQQTVSRLGMGGISCAPPPMYSSTQSVYSEGTSDSSQSLGIIQKIALIAWKAQHHASRFFFPTSKAGRRKKSDDPLSDLEDILLEEGANTMSHRRRGNGHNNAGDDDDIDYFSRAMNQNGSGGWRKSKKKKSESKTAKMGCLFCVMAIALSIYRMSLRESVNYIKQSNKRAFKTGVEVDRSYGSNKHGKDLHYDTKANDVNNEVYYGDDGGDRLGQLVKESDEQRKYPVQYEVQVPPVFDGLANVDDMLFQRGIDIPFYWHIPRSGGGTMNDVLGSCLHLTLAADAGGSQGHDQHETLEVIQFSSKVSYVNVDTSTHQGIDRAKRLNLVSAGLADVVISPLLHKASTLFTSTQRGRMFTIIRHPVDRAASLFYFIQETQWKQSATRSDQFADISIEEFYKSGFAENNWMVRFLVNELTKELTENDLTIAKEILRQKCLVGLLEEKDETLARLQQYFGWTTSDEDKRCTEKKLDWAWPMKHKHPMIEKDSKAWRLIVANNSFDMKLYDFAKELFNQQGQQLFP